MLLYIVTTYLQATHSSEDAYKYKSAHIYTLMASATQSKSWSKSQSTVQSMSPVQSPCRVHVLHRPLDERV